MPVRQTLEQLNADARQHCNGCAKCDALRDSWAMCSGVRVGFANGTCPLGLWDHSAPIKHTPRPRVPYVQICMGRHLEWPVKVWEQIQKCPLHGRKYHVPRELYDAIKDEWLG